MMERDGDVQTIQVENSKARTLLPLIEKNVTKGSTIHTDEANAYKSLSKRGYGHEQVDHGRKEYVRGDVTTNSLEGYWARLKNSIRGTHVHVSKKYLDLYADEFEYRYNRRKSPQTMFPELISSFAPFEEIAASKASTSPSPSLSCSAMNWSSLPSLSAFFRVIGIRFCLQAACPFDA